MEAISLHGHGGSIKVIQSKFLTWWIRKELI